MRKVFSVYLILCACLLSNAQSINSFSEFKSYISDLNSACPTYNDDGSITASIVLAEEVDTWAIFYEINYPDWLQMKNAGEKKLLRAYQKIFKNMVKQNHDFKNLIEASVKYNYSLEVVFVSKPVYEKRASVYTEDTEICIRYEPKELKKFLK